jgi:hypothetical protein
MASTSGRKAWWRRYFHVHPALLVNKQDVTGYFGATTSGKQKLYCIKCFDQHIATLQRQDEDEVARGVRQNKRDLPQLEAFCEY